MVAPAPGVVIVGAGHAGFAVATALRSLGHDAPITVIGAEPGLPYQRPPLSKGYLLGTVDRTRLALRPEDFYSRRKITLKSGVAVIAIDRCHRTVTLASGEDVPFETLVLATGAQPRALAAPGSELGGIFTLRTVADVDALRPRLATARTLAVVGGGFIGLELAAVASSMGIRTTVVEAAGRLLERSVSAPTAEHLAGVHRSWGTEILADARVERFIDDHEPDALGIRMARDQTVCADVVVVGVGAVPEVRLAAQAGLAVEDGILVDQFLCTADRRVFAIGDCARFLHVDGATTIRRESLQNATDQGRAVARTITGEPCPFESVPWFWSDQRDIKLQIAGDVSGHDEAEIVGDPATGSFSTRCYRAGVLVGVESINRPTDHVAARKQLHQCGIGTSGHSAEATESIGSVVRGGLAI